MYLRPEDAPFQYERSVQYVNCCIFPLARLFDSLVRVSRRVKVPHWNVVNKEYHGEASIHWGTPSKWNVSQLSSSLIPRSFHQGPHRSALVASRIEIQLDNAGRVVLTKNGGTSIAIVTTSGSMSLSFQSAFQTFAHATCSLSVFPLCI